MIMMSTYATINNYTLTRMNTSVVMVRKNA